MAHRDRHTFKGVARPPSAPPSAGVKRKERDYEQDTGDETNINVVVRCRGRSDREVRENSGVVVSTTGVRGKSVELCMGPNAISNKTYHFDKVFSPAADQTILFEDVVSPILGEMLSGYNCTIFAYGQTGTGKTYTMSGDMTETMGLLSDAAGIIPRVLYSLFQKLEADETECSVKCSFIELYNEELRDLLSADDTVKLKIYDDASKKNNSTTVVQGMEETHIKSAAEGIKRLQEGSHRRQVAATKCNDLSSRSHTVFTITTYIKKLNDSGEDYICSGKLNLVDLAGSENIQRSGAENKRAAEAGLINKSLLTLGRVINALVDKSAHIPYRESKLTRLLQDSLGGRTKTYIIATISPAKSNLEETISTLDYAFRAKNIRNKPQLNSMISKKTLLKEFTSEIEKLKSELIATRQRNGVYLTNEQFEEMTVESESRRILSEEQRARIETMEISLRNKLQEFFNLTNTFTTLKKDNEATRIAFENTKDVLSKTEIALSNTAQNLEEETTLRKAHEATEGKLRTIGTQLISTVDESVRDVDRLHAKLRRRSDLHLHNQESWSASTFQVLDVSQSVDNRLEQLQTQQKSLLDHLSSRIQDFVAEEMQRALQGRTTVQKSVIELGERSEQIERRSLHEQDQMNEVLEEIKVLREDVKVKVGEGLNGLSDAAARIAGEVITELEQFHTQLHSSYSRLGKDFKQIFDETSKELIAQRAESDRLREELQHANSRQITASVTTSDNIEAYIQAERQAAEEEREALMGQISALIRTSHTKRDVRLTGVLTDIKSDVIGCAEHFEGATSAFNTGMDKWATNDSALLDRMNRSKEELKMKMQRDWIAIEARNTAIQSSTKSVHEETIKIVDAQLGQMSTQMAALDDFVTRARHQNDSNCGAHRSNVLGLKSNLDSAFTMLDTCLTGDGLQAFSNDILGQALSISDALKPLAEEVRQPLQTLTSHFATTTLQNYVPTGETPAKKQWNYPTSLPYTITDAHTPQAAPSTPAPPTKAPNYARTKSKSPKKLASPRKMQVKEVYVDTPPRAIITSAAPQPNPIPPAAITRTDSTKSMPTLGPGLREIDINTVPSTSTTISIPVSSSEIAKLDKEDPATNFKSRVPQLRATRSTAGKNPLSMSVGPGAAVSDDGNVHQKENVPHAVEAKIIARPATAMGLASAVSVVHGNGRRLRNSPAQ